METTMETTKTTMETTKTTMETTKTTMETTKITLETMTDNEKLEFCEKKLKMATINLFTKKITKEEYTKIFDKYCPYITYYRRKLNKSNLFELTKNDSDDDELFSIVDLQGVN